MYINFNLKMKNKGSNLICPAILHTTPLLCDLPKHPILVTQVHKSILKDTEQ